MDQPGVGSGETGYDPGELKWAGLLLQAVQRTGQSGHRRRQAAADPAGDDRGRDVRAPADDRWTPGRGARPLHARAVGRGHGPVEEPARTLPLSNRRLRSIAVIGPDANRLSAAAAARW